MFDFKVGQKYKTRNGKIAIINKVLENTHFFYSVLGSCDTKVLQWSDMGRHFNMQNPSPYDLVDLIEDVPTVKGNEMNKHRNYEFIVAFAEGKEVENFYNNKWHTVTDLDQLSTYTQFRIKPKTKTINGFEVPVPMDKEPEQRSKYYYPCVTSNEFYSQEVFSLKWDTKNFERGICFSNKEDAIKTAKAMLGIDPNT